MAIKKHANKKAPKKSKDGIGDYVGAEGLEVINQFWASANKPESKTSGAGGEIKKPNAPKKSGASNARQNARISGAGNKSNLGISSESEISSHSNPPEKKRLFAYDEQGKFLPDAIKENGERASNFLSSAFRNFLIFCALFVFIAIMASLFLSTYSPKPSWHWGAESSPLIQTASLYLKPAQQWQYLLIGSMGEKKALLGTFIFPSCPGIVLADLTNSQTLYGSLDGAMKKDPGVFAVCIGKEGYEIDSNGKRLGNLLEFSNTSYPYFAPWMLALSDNFSLNANRTLTVMPANYTVKYPFSIKVLNSSKIFGRDAYVVSLKSDPAQPIPDSGEFSQNSELIYYIDKESRMLLQAQYLDSKLVLSKAPFALEN